MENDGIINLQKLLEGEFVFKIFGDENLTIIQFENGAKLILEEFEIEEE